jgi:membrane protease YdiL (CAAX protease family)
MALPATALYAAGIALAVALALLWWPGRPRAGWTEAVGAALVAYPVARALVGAAAVSDRLTRYTVLLPASAPDFERAILRDSALGFLLPLAGALLLWRKRAGGAPVRSARDALAGVARALEPAGLGGAPRRTLLDALAVLGVALLLLGASLAGQAYAVPFLVTGDESAYWQNLTPALLVGLSVAAGVSEELVWRGLLLRALLSRIPFWPALLLQAGLFGFIHAGYGNWAHVLGPALFGLLMGVVALRVSLLAAMAVHAGVDIAYLALAAPQLQPGILALPLALAIAGLVALAATRFAVVRALLELDWRKGWRSAGDAPATFTQLQRGARP